MSNIYTIAKKRLEDPGGTAVTLGTAIAGNLLMPGYGAIMPVISEVAGQILGPKVTKYVKDLLFGESEEEIKQAKDEANRSYQQKVQAHEEAWADQLHHEYFPVRGQYNSPLSGQTMTKQQIMSSGKAFQAGPGGSLVTFNGGFIPTFYKPKY